MTKAKNGNVQVKPNFSIASVGEEPSTYILRSSLLPSISVNDKGQITRVANVAVSIGDGGGLNPFLLLGVG